MSSGPPYNDYDRRGPPPPRGGDSYGRPPPRYGGHYGGGGGGPPRHHYNNRGPPPPYNRGGGGYNNRGPPPPRRRNRNPDLITFRSYEEEQEWLEDRRRKRQARASKFDVQPTPEQLQAQQAAAAVAAMTLPGATGALGGAPLTQQTRHARRIYVGNLPPNITESQIQDAFLQAIQQALVMEDPSAAGVEPNPILNVYIDKNRRFSFVEFTSVELTTACMQLDGLIVHGQALKIKRPNDYNAFTAPQVADHQIPKLDVSRLGIVGSTVSDGPNKIFIGGLHYHLQEPQVVELLSAFGKIKAFHLVSNPDQPGSSKGYCFVEYADPNVTAIAVQGLNGMEIGGGKSLTARLAGGHAAAPAVPVVGAIAPMAAVNNTAASSTGNMPPPNHTIVQGYDVEDLVDAAMGLKQMPLAPTYMDPVTRQPLTRVVPFAVAAPPPLPPAVAAAAAAANHRSAPTRVLVLHNMVTDEDLATEEDYQGLKQEIADECRKYGNLEQLRIPKVQKVVYLQYATVAEAQAAQRELQGRQFGSATVETNFASEQELEQVEG